MKVGLFQRAQLRPLPLSRLHLGGRRRARRPSGREPCGNLIFSRFLFSAAALAPPCGIIGMFGDAPVVLNCPSFSRLPELSCANAADASSVQPTRPASCPCA